jgi:hypothetical protein
MGNGFETERLLFCAGNSFLANRQLKTTKDKAADFHWIT